MKFSQTWKKFAVCLLITATVLTVAACSAKNYYPPDDAAFSCREYHIKFDVDNTRIDPDKFILSTEGEMTLVTIDQDLPDSWTVCVEFKKSEIIIWNLARVRINMSKDPDNPDRMISEYILDDNAWLIKGSYRYDGELLVMTVKNVHFSNPPFDVGQILTFERTQ